MKLVYSKTTEKQLEEMKRAKNRTAISSNFWFLRDHNGIRLGELSVIVAPSGMGKSTFVRTLISEIVPQDLGVLVGLSEEDIETFHSPILQNFSNVFGGFDKANSLLKKLYYVSLQDLDRSEQNLESFMKSVEEMIVGNDISVFIFDNFTTSFFNRMNINIQAEAIEKFKKLAQRLKIAFILVTHTAKGTDPYKHLVTGEHTRGNATATNIGAYNYILTTFFRLKKPRTFVFVDKARHHNKANKKYYELYYDPEMEIFIRDKKSDVYQLTSCMAQAKKG